MKNEVKVTETREGSQRGCRMQVQDAGKRNIGLS